MGANSLPSAESNFDLDEQISQLMQCKPLSEHQVCFPLVRHDPFRVDAEFTVFRDLKLFGVFFFFFVLCLFRFLSGFGISENGRIDRIEMDIALTRCAEKNFLFYRNGNCLQKRFSFSAIFSAVSCSPDWIWM